MPSIPLNQIKATWLRFFRLSKEQRQSLFNQFRRDQPALHQYVSQQDKEGFSKGPAQIQTLALFVWLVFATANRGKVPAVTEKQICDLLAKGIAKMDLLEEESEIRAWEIGVKDLMRHPQIDLLMFLMDFLTHKEDCFELIPTSTKAAHSHLDVVIRTLNAATFPKAENTRTDETS